MSTSNRRDFLRVAGAAGLTGKFPALNYDYSKAGNLTAADLYANQGRIATFNRRLQFGFRVQF